MLTLHSRVCTTSQWISEGLARFSGLGRGAAGTRLKFCFGISLLWGKGEAEVTDARSRGLRHKTWVLCLLNLLDISELSLGFYQMEIVVVTALQ